MKVTKVLLEEFVRLEGVDPQKICQVLSQIGLEVESFQDLRVPEGVVVGRVLQKTPHADADKLSVCEVDVGEEVLQIVCGASNVAQDQFVAVAKIGSVLQTPKGELKIAPTQLRGVASNGMLCSSVELGLPKYNEGIMVLDSSVGELRVGKPLCEYPIFDDYVIELGLTPNRGDCLSVLGVARDLSVAMGLPFVPKTYKDENSALGIGRVLQVVYQGKHSSSLLYKVANIALAQTPLKLKLSLLECGFELGVPLQDFITYATHLSGVILKAYCFCDFTKNNLTNNAEAQLLLKQDENGMDGIYTDSQKLSSIGVYYAKRECHNDLMILEASHCDASLLAQKIFECKEINKDPELVYRTTRGSNPNLELGMQVLCHLLIQYSHSEIYSGVHRVSSNQEIQPIRTTFASLIGILGDQIQKEEIASILKKLGFKLDANFDESFFMITPPEYRQDIKTSQDLAEEVLRIYGIDRIESKPAILQENPKACNAIFKAYKQKREWIKRACANGFVETLHYVFYEREKLQKLILPCVKEELDLLNPITQELDTLRTSLLPAMLESVERNERFGFKAIALCEVGICYDTERQASEKIAFVVNEYKTQERFPHCKGEKWDFYSFCSFLGRVIGEFELQAVEKSECLLFHPYQQAKILQNHQEIGIIAKLHPMSGYEISNAFVCELDVKALLNLQSQKGKNFSKYQASLRDLTILIESNISFAKVKQAILQEKIKDLKEVYPLDLYTHSTLGTQVALSLRCVLQSDEKTLQEEELNEAMQKILACLQTNFNATLRQ